MITKTDFLVYLEAPRHFWALKNNKYDLTISDFDKHLITQGYIVETKAKEYAKRYLLPSYATNDSDLVFQRTCLDGDFEARTDILVRNATTNKWDIYEVKSVTKPKPEHYYDTTFQTIIFEKHMDIGNVFILHVNNDYVREGDFDLGLFLVAEDVTQKVKELKEETLNKMKDCQFLVGTDNYKLATECWKPKECHCKGLCFPSLPNDSIYNLARVTEKKILDLRDNDILNITDIPDDFDLTTNQRIQVEVAKRNTPLINHKAIKQELETLEYPLYFLDYETYDPAIPMYDWYKPYQQMVFQYSLHVLESPNNKDLKHYEYVVKTKSEPCRELLTHMKQYIGNTGSVIVWYKAFECSRNREMGQICMDFAEFLENVNGRVYDLMDIFKNNLYVDPKFKGSNSIKDVLPVLVPELNYKNLNIQNGTMAMTNWHKMVYKITNQKEKDELLKNLLTYCEQDTLAMVRIWDFLRQLA
ncbi:hypothetical protein A3K34_02305 [candidate division WWE3 bacterium RIFOXYC1_FULL_40_10]|uniref:DUF2779 domain-containing protein n=1 Tax=candidate division WWE3 bacterium RIFOXYA2_FULL_46_9 TaxID=1802636 RepID=A0A1F4VYS6_UNCKA|nr:MAG: hypothetical protein A3K58_02305 [candidate division WWE3 bacterium RIFOXYB1_FULL_40_22]OGC61686.1 MAG: hypothetical protein A3K37_02305 [candidate division WWE3 bacterium RIFOXYA1_FULL_40_11]OGC62329.1 MAG: hypothetical protein A2264_02065 [candidate division WWE3 bacterium RIFOXYA2_FULL_46_9]OGC64861.1 MAG: hypothetical protein A2326_01130 [candidate division WWE3 bacterium RIFOXYB2_FULL_41_6]OGC66069.1 MAG: hypothetical protein A3K34_02305 [candidate division WWE3 bacterium RIFOXYC1_